MTNKHKKLISISLIAAIVGVSVMGVATAVLYRINQDNSGEFAATSAPPEVSCIQESRACNTGGNCYCGAGFTPYCYHDQTYCKAGSGWCTNISCTRNATAPTPTNSGSQPTSTPTATPRCVSILGSGYSDVACGNASFAYGCTIGQRACLPNKGGAVQCITDAQCVGFTGTPTATPVPTCKPNGSTATNQSECCTGYGQSITSGFICADRPPTPTSFVCKGNGTVVTNQSECCTGYGQSITSGFICATKPVATPVVGIIENDCGFTNVFKDGGVCGQQPGGTDCDYGQLQCSYIGGGHTCKPAPDYRSCPAAPATAEAGNVVCEQQFPGSHPKDGGFDGCFGGYLVCTKDGEDQAFDYNYCRSTAAAGAPSLPPTASVSNPTTKPETIVSPTPTDEPGFTDPLTGFRSAASIIFSNSLSTVILLAFIVISSLFGITVFVYQSFSKKN